ncbi:MAG: thermonuclease family protein [Planctomycetota bacterium]|nr:thermonuclease family protein [Planctomycetota bacterium]
MFATLASRPWSRCIFFVLATLALAVPALAPETARAAPKERVHVPHALVQFDDGDTIRIRWPNRDAEEIRLLGIDTPEVMHLEHDIPYAQPFGEVAAGFLRGCIAASERLELLRSGNQDKYGRTLGFLFVDGRNYSVLVIEARLAYGPNPRFGDNGLPAETKACMDAAERAGPPAFEPPWEYRTRMRAVSEFMRADGSYPSCPSPPEPK